MLLTTYYRSRHNTIHKSDCPYRPATLWSFANGFTEWQVTEQIRLHPWLRWCKVCGPADD